MRSEICTIICFSQIGVPSGLYHHSDYTDYRMAYSLVKGIPNLVDREAAK